ncbi:di-heme oxidoredictase family protein [Aliisedimentitalea scapharcae]|uniref:Di-heme oxidoredictase family protein n=2 Tax=Aliisedimentitalea scapharcae TaxID=1524259 RepID=A0ABZ2XWL6_9RHOB
MIMVQHAVTFFATLCVSCSSIALASENTADQDRDPAVSQEFDPGWSHLAVAPWTQQEQNRARIAVERPVTAQEPEAFEAYPGGAATGGDVFGQDAFSQPSGNMEFEQKLEFQLGNAFFEKLWVSSPSSTKASDGLGPLYNARACQSCHIRDGRGAAPDETGDSGSLLFKISVPEIGATDRSITASAPDPVYGGQIQDHSLPGLRAEGRIDVQWSERPVTLADGMTVHLRVPDHQIVDLGWGPFAKGARLSPRVAPQMIGLGLLEAIPATEILAGADPDDHDADGISGRANLVWSDRYQRTVLGRFGLKAASPTVRDQSAAAFSFDIGISSSMHPDPWGDCTAAQPACQAAPHGNDDARFTEIDDIGLDLITFYSRNLAVPARRNANAPQVLRGKAVFHQSGCADCHRPKFVTHKLPDQPEQSFQLIWPYTDMLLHDMGDGLADDMPKGLASGREWRTPPLWGLGLTTQVSPDAGFLHDGRARTMLEAVLWHGGEARASRDAVISLSAEDRDALLRFLASL